jgi:hypothetical protein
VALASAGAVASASSTLSGYPIAAVNDGIRTGPTNGFWADGTASTFPDSVQILFNGSKTIDRVIVYSIQDAYTSPVEPTDVMTFSLYGLVDFTVEGWNGSAWVTLGTVTGNNLVKRTVTFAAFATDRIRVNVTNALASYSRIVEIEALDPTAPPPGGTSVVCTTTADIQLTTVLSTNQYFFHDGFGTALSGTRTGSVAFKAVSDYSSLGGGLKYSGSESVSAMAGNNGSKNIQHVMSTCPGDFTNVASPNGICSRYGTEGNGGINWHTANSAIIAANSCGPLDESKTYYLNVRYVDPATGQTTCNPNVYGGLCNTVVGLQPQ